MVFSSFIFIFGFLPIFLTLYYCVPGWLKFGAGVNDESESYFASSGSGRNFVALVASYLFYAWGAPTIAPLLLATSLFDYALVQWMQRPRTSRSRLLFCQLGVVANIGLLAYYKYANFFIAQLDFLGYAQPEWVKVVLPIGISFFTFQKISYIIDVYRGETKPASSVLDYLLYVVLFPQLIAGPILRYHDVEGQIRQRRHSLDLLLYGCVRFSIGLTKKILLANEMGAVVDNVFKLGSDSLSWYYALIGAVAYAFQIYFDFSGYSDMAIGLCAMMGFRISENFRMPYRSASITEFWRRWHISLSQWMKEYLYIPLGGNRRGSLITMRNLWLVFLLSGFWHGASWTFVAWGAMHGLFLSIERLGLARLLAILPRIIGVLYTWIVLLITWVLFRAEDFGIASYYIDTIVSFKQVSNPPSVAMVIHERGRFAFAVCCAIVFLSLPNAIAQRWESALAFPLRRPGLLFVFSYLGLLLSVLTLATTVFNPFIYFRF